MKATIKRVKCPLDETEVEREDREAYDLGRGEKEDEKLIKEMQRNAAYKDPTMGAATIIGAQAQAMQDAAKNSGGAAVGFMGLNMAQGAGGVTAARLYQMGQQQPAQQAAAAPAAEGWTCPQCGKTGNTGKSCGECGESKPADAAGWTCPKCGAVNKGKFCAECGAPKPAGEPLYKCDKCGWEPEDPKNPPKFCPNCGDPFDTGDIVG